MVLSERDRRALKAGAVGIVVIAGLLLGMRWLDHWGGVRKSLGERRARLNALSISESRRAGLAAIVPVFEMPRDEQRQKFLFLEKFNEQLKKTGIKVETMQFLPPVKSPEISGYRVLRLQCRKAKCNFGQAMDLLANLKDNPYWAGIEEFKLSCDKNKRQEFELNMTVSMLVK
jgi:hypothetical protein